MNITRGLLLLSLGLALFTAACGNPQKSAYKAQEKIHKERLALVKKYQECIKKATEENTDKDVCEQYLKAAEALK